MYNLVKVMLASILGVAIAQWLDDTPAGTFLIASLSVLLWLSIAKDVLAVLRLFGF